MSERVPVWVWIAAGIGLLVLLRRGTTKAFSVGEVTSQVTTEATAQTRVPEITEALEMSLPKDLAELRAKVRETPHGVTCTGGNCSGFGWLLPETWWRKLVGR